MKKILKYIWLATSFLCVGTGIHQTINEGFNKSYVFFLFAIFAFVMFLYRKNERTSNANKT
jgi:hypothetical protein